MNNIFKILKHEFKLTANNKAFIILTLLGPFLIAALTILPSLMGNPNEIPEGTIIGIYGGDTEFYNEISTALASAGIESITVQNEATAKDQVLNGELSALLVVPDNHFKDTNYTYYSKTGNDIVISSVLNDRLSKSVTALRLKKSGLSSEAIENIQHYPYLTTKKIKGKTDGFNDVMFTSIGFMMLIYMTVLLYGQTIGRSVLLEKSSKTVDILLSSVKPRDILYGKIFGIGLAALLQYTVWMCIAFIIINFVGPGIGIAIPASVNIQNFAYLVLFFFLAFFLYASISAAIGSGAADEQHLGQLLIPMTIMLIIPMLLVSAIVFKPDSTLIRVFSMIPFTSPLVMLVRIIVSQPPAAEIILCIGILLVSIPVIVMIASKIFRIGILMTGKRYSLKEILKWMKTE